MENRVIEFGYSSNLGGVEVFIKNPYRFGGNNAGQDPF